MIPGAVGLRLVVRLRAAVVLGGLTGLAGLAGCEAVTCDEDIRAQVLDQRVTLTIGDEAIEAELADQMVERERGWMHRRCGREGLLLVPMERSALPVWGCGLIDAVDLYFIRAGTVVELTRGLPPCDAPCGECPVVGDEIEVDAVLETPAGALAVDVGAVVRGWPSN